MRPEYILLRVQYCAGWISFARMQDSARQIPVQVFPLDWIHHIFIC